MMCTLSFFGNASKRVYKDGRTEISAMHTFHGADLDDKDCLLVAQLHSRCRPRVLAPSKDNFPLEVEPYRTVSYLQLDGC